MKKQNPSWKYAPHKRMGHDEIEPMPSRLRPRDKLKRKVNSEMFVHKMFCLKVLIVLPFYAFK
jgi:hypothetical protein